MSCTVRISRWIRASAPKIPRLRGMPVDLLAGQVLRDQRHFAGPGVKLLERAGRRPARRRPYSAACSGGGRWPRRGCRRPGRRSGRPRRRRGTHTRRRRAAVGAVVVRAALGVDQRLVGEGDAPERCRVAAVVRVRGAGGLAVRHFDFLLRRRHGDPKDLVMRAVALRQARILCLDGASGRTVLDVRPGQFNRLGEERAYRHGMVPGGWHNSAHADRRRRQPAGILWPRAARRQRSGGVLPGGRGRGPAAVRGQLCRARAASVEKALASGVDALVVVGGDGMVHLGVNALAGSGMPVRRGSAGDRPDRDRATTWRGRWACRSTTSPAACERCWRLWPPAGG